VREEGYSGNGGGYYSIKVNIGRFLYQCLGATGNQTFYFVLLAIKKNKLYRPVFKSRLGPG
jgi:hypothetical protein